AVSARHAGHHHDTTCGELVASFLGRHPGDEGRLVHAHVGLDVHRNLIASNFTANRSRKEAFGRPARLAVARRGSESIDRPAMTRCRSSSHPQWAETSLPTDARRVRFY